MIFSVVIFVGVFVIVNSVGVILLIFLLVVCVDNIIVIRRVKGLLWFSGIGGLG